MAKLNQSRGKLVRKFSENIFGNPKYDRLLNRKPYGPGQHAQNRRPKVSNYGTQLHEKQKRKGTSIPYFFHLVSVSSLVIENGGNTDESIAGLLHDAVEDQGGTKTLIYIKKKFGNKVAKIVDDCTDAIVIPKPPWYERKKLYLSKLKDKYFNDLIANEDKMDCLLLNTSFSCIHLILHF